MCMWDCEDRELCVCVCVCGGWECWVGGMCADQRKGVEGRGEGGEGAFHLWCTHTHTHTHTHAHTHKHTHTHTHTVRRLI